MEVSPKRSKLFAWLDARGGPAQAVRDLDVDQAHADLDGLVYRWTDYWDMNKFISQFPGWFLEEMARHSADEFTD